MKKKLSFIVVLVVFSLLFSALALGASYKSGPELVVSLISQSPDPVEPGEIITVKFKVENKGSETSGDVIVTLMPKFPFTMYGDTEIRNIGQLKYTSTSDSEIIEFKLKVDENAVEKETELELKIESSGGTSRGSGISYTDDDFLIDIETRDAILEITSIDFNPEQVPPGGVGDIKISIKNLADSLLNDITFDLDFSGDIPLAPYQSTSQRQIDTLKSNNLLPLSFKVIAKPDATPGLYKVPLNITYNDEQGNKYSVNEILAVRIGDIPKLKTYIKRSSVLQNKNAGTITLEVANSGTTDIKFLEVLIQDSEQFDLVSTSNYFYIGDVDSDDTESEELEVYIKTKEDVLKIPVELKYTDANNIAYSQQIELPLNLYSKSQLKKFGVIETSNSGLYFVIIILLIVAFIIYRKQPKWLPKWLRKKVKKTS
jgi:hypothetical protein